MGLSVRSAWSRAVVMTSRQTDNRQKDRQTDSSFSSRLDFFFFQFVAPDESLMKCADTRSSFIPTTSPLRCGLSARG